MAEKPRLTEEEIGARIREGDIKTLEEQARRLRAIAWDVGDRFGALGDAARVLERASNMARDDDLLRSSEKV